MNKFLLLCLIGFTACSTPEIEVPEAAAIAETTHSDSTSGNSKNQQTLYSWTNLSEDSIRVSLSYTIQDSVVVGEITYKNLMPAETLSIIGTIEPDGRYRLLEFENGGTITHVLT